MTAITLTHVLVSVLNILVGGVLVALVRARPALKKIAADREANLLTERAEEMEAMRIRLSTLETKLEEKDRQHEAERRVDRHRINNLGQCLDALLLLIEQDPQKATEAAIKIRKMRNEQLARESEERAIVLAAVVGEMRQ